MNRLRRAWVLLQGERHPDFLDAIEGIEVHAIAEAMDRETKRLRAENADLRAALDEARAANAALKALLEEAWSNVAGFQTTLRGIRKMTDDGLADHGARFT
jgi:hypothetical protein